MKGQQIKYSDEELAFIKKKKGLPRKTLHSKFCEKFNRIDISQINLSALCKRKGWMTGRTGCFKKGNMPHPDAHPKGPNKTSFKKGNLPVNWRPLGSTRISKDGYIEIKTKEPNKWESNHVNTWEKENGKVPEGFCVSFKDSDKMNCDPCNLELISRNDNLQINRLSSCNDSVEIKSTIRVLGKLISKTCN